MTLAFLAKELTAIKIQLANLQKKEDELKAQINAHLDELNVEKVTGDDFSVVRALFNVSYLDQKALKEEAPELVAKHTSQRPQIRLTVKGV